jgi:hypothetical protein
MNHLLALTQVVPSNNHACKMGDEERMPWSQARAQGAHQHGPTRLHDRSWKGHEPNLGRTLLPTRVLLRHLLFD